jgi:hypothetical protein
VPGRRENAWKEDEIKLLEALIKKFNGERVPMKYFKEIAEHIPTRTSRACESHYRDHLKKKIVHKRRAAVFDLSDWPQTSTSSSSEEQAKNLHPHEQDMDISSDDEDTSSSEDEDM